MPDSNIIQIDQNLFETKLDRLVTEKMTQILNAMLDAEADEITGAARYERKEGRKAYRAGHYERTLTAKAGRLELRVPKLKGAVFESAVIERYRRRESSVEEALMEMYLAGVSTRQVDDISKLLWGDRMPSQTLSDKLKRVYDDIDRWRTRPLESEYPYVFMDGVWHKRSWGGSVENVSVLVAIGVNAEGHREVIGVTEGMREDAASWEQFIRSMIERGLKGVRLVVGDRCAGLVSTVNSMLPRAKYQRCMVHFMRNVLSKVPPNHRDWASAALKAIFAMESRESALAKAGTVAAEMESRKLKAAAGCLREGIGETTAYLLPEYLQLSRPLIIPFQGHRYCQRRPVADRFKATDPLWSGFEHGLSVPLPHVELAGVDPYRVVHDAVEDGVGDGVAAETAVPFLGGQLGRERGAGVVVAQFHELKQEAPELLVGLVHEPFVDREQRVRGVFAHELGRTSRFEGRGRDLFREVGHPYVAGPVASPARGFHQRA